MSSQLAIPVDVRPEEIAREKTLGGALELCAKVAGFSLDKTLQQELGVDKAQFSRWHSGTEGIVWPKFVHLMDTCGNDAPLLWMLHQRAYDLTSLRKRETELERQNRELREQISTLMREREVELRLLSVIRHN
jgi:plasmid maintenance system antidote protein VapI